MSTLGPPVLEVFVRLSLLSVVFVVGCSVATPAVSPVDLDPRVPDLMDRVQILETNQAEIAQRSLRNGQLEQKVSELETRVAMVCDLAAEQAIAKGPTRNKGTIPPIPGRMSSFVTNQVVRSATQNAMSYWAPSHGSRTPSYNARHAAFERVAAMGGYEMWHPTYDTWREQVLDVARHHLSDPARLDATYRKHKGTLVAELHTLEKADDIKEHLQGKVLPAFEQPVSSQTRTLHRDASKRWEGMRAMAYENPCRKEVSGTYNERDAAFRSSVKADPFAVQFRLRREAEGGDALVNAWARILRDLAESL